jgi:putative hydrolase of the HAD superfamily
MIKAVLFDYGGVLTEGGKRDSALALINQFYGRELPRERYEVLHLAMRCGELTTREFFGAIRDAYGSGRAMTVEEWNNANAGSYHLSAPVYELAARLREAGMQTGVVSNIHAFEASHIRDLGGYDGFDPVILSPDVHAAKPDRAIYEAALGRLGVEPYEILFIDDQDKCLPAAQELGMLTLKALAPDQIVRDVSALIKRENGVEI